MWITILQEIFQLCIIPLLGILTTYLVKYIRKKNKEIDSTLTNDLSKKYIDELAQIIEECVISTNQTYVENMKDKNAFDEEAQKQAFNKTLEAINTILSEEAKKHLTEVYGDLNIYIINKIEAEVNNCKCGKIKTKEKVLLNE